MPRHRGTYNPEISEPYEVSRTKIDNFIRCPACFWMDRVKGIKFPDIPPFLLNTATDTLLKKDFDKYREVQKPHPFMVHHNLGHLVPFKHEDFHKWTQSRSLGLRTYFEDAHLIIGGGLDDVWHDPKKDELFVVDYKSTAGKASPDKSGLLPIDLNDHYKSSVKRQMIIYQWILRKNGFNVNDTGYLLYVNGDQHFQDGMLNDEENENFDIAKMFFKVELIPYEGDSSWVEETIMDLKNCLISDVMPDHAITGYGAKGDKPCQHGAFIEQVKSKL